MATRYYRATARDMTVARSTRGATHYTWAVVTHYGDGQTWTAAVFTATREDAERRLRGRIGAAFVVWAELAPAVEIDAAEYQQIRARL